MMNDEINMEKNNVDKNWFTKHAETLTVIASLFGGFVWMDSKFTSIDGKFEKVNERLAVVEKDVAVIKTLLSVKGISCNELTARDHREEKENRG